MGRGERKGDRKSSRTNPQSHEIGPISEKRVARVKPGIGLDTPYPLGRPTRYIKQVWGWPKHTRSDLMKSCCCSWLLAHYVPLDYRSRTVDTLEKW